MQTGFSKRRPAAAAILTSAALIAGAAVFVGCGGGGSGSGDSINTTSTPTTTPRTASINVVGMSFGSPITVSSGTVVTWNNISGLTHNVFWDSRSPTTAPSPGANLGDFNTGTTTSWTAPTVTASATYQYHCTIHGPMMSSSITVTP